jgi:hypothetical protein
VLDPRSVHNVGQAGTRIAPAIDVLYNWTP